MIFISLVILYLALFVWMACYAYKYEGVFSTIFIFGVAAFMYFLVIPLEVYFSGNDVFFVHDRRLEISDMCYFSCFLS